MFLRNAWYAAALAEDLGRDLLARTICKDPVVLFRTAGGLPAALTDRCCHRSLPLSLGRLIGDRLQCGYHGLEFDATGACVAVPGQSRIPPGAAVKAYPVVERDLFIWIWMGDPALADPAAIPDYHWNSDPDWPAVGGAAEVKCHYMLSIDNLLDLTHLPYVHASTLGAEAITDNPITVTRRADSVTVERWMIDVDPGPFWAEAIGRNAGCDRWQITTYRPPSHTFFDIGVAATGTGAPQGSRVDPIAARLAITLTPVDETTSLYAWVFARNYRKDDAETSRRIKAAVDAAYGEDFIALEAQQQSMLGSPEPWKIDVNADAGQIAGRALHDRVLTAAPARRAAAAE